MAFDPHRDVSVASGAFRVDVNELCAAHTLLSHQRALFIGPARFALGAALTQAEMASTLAPTPPRQSDHRRHGGTRTPRIRD